MMRDRLEGRAGALVIVSVLGALGCGDYDPAPSGDAAGSSAGNGGTAGGSGGSSSGSGGSGGSSSGSGGMAGAGGGPATSSASGCTRAEGGTAVTSLCSSAPLNTLTQAEQVALCSDTAAYVTSVIDRPIGCKYVAIVASASSSAPTEAEMQAVCAAREMACNQDETVMGAGALTQCSGIPATCAATVEQYSACVIDEALVFEQEAGALVGCSMLTLANLSTLYEVPMAATNAPGCTALRTACPTFNLPYIN